MSTGPRDQSSPPRRCVRSRARAHAKPVPTYPAAEFSLHAACCSLSSKSQVRGRVSLPPRTLAVQKLIVYLVLRHPNTSSIALLRMPGPPSESSDGLPCGQALPVAGHQILLCRRLDSDDAAKLVRCGQGAFLAVRGARIAQWQQRDLALGSAQLLPDEIIHSLTRELQTVPQKAVCPCKVCLEH